jgi:hypothetical protein
VRRALAGLACTAAVALSAGCGLGEGDAIAGGATVRVTRDFGRVELGRARTHSLHEGETVISFLRSKFDVMTRFGGGFVQSIDGQAGEGPSGQRDWFYFVNGVEGEVGAAQYDVSAGDRIQWDLRRWQAAMRVPAIVGAFPEPFLNGIEGKRRPVRVECGETEEEPCSDAKAALENTGVPVSRASLGAPGTEAVVRLVVARWPQARIVRGASTLEEGPETSGVFARFAGDGQSLDLLDEDGEVARTVRPGDGTALVAALRPRDDELVWLVTSLDQAGLAAGVAALGERQLRDAFAVAVTGSSVEKLPLVAP